MSCLRKPVSAHIRDEVAEIVPHFDAIDRDIPPAGEAKRARDQPFSPGRGKVGDAGRLRYGDAYILTKKQPQVGVHGKGQIGQRKNRSAMSRACRVQVLARNRHAALHFFFRHRIDDDARVRGEAILHEKGADTFDVDVHLRLDLLLMHDFVDRQFQNVLCSCCFQAGDEDVYVRFIGDAGQ